jgi:hypothetical protein
VAAKRNITPMSTPTVVIEALSNWRTTSAATIHSTPVTSQSHHIPDSPSIASRSVPARSSTGYVVIVSSSRFLAGSSAADG